MKVAMTTINLKPWMTADLASLIAQVKLAEQAGLYQYDVPDHLINVATPVSYPYGDIAVNLNGMPFYEPVTLLLEIAAVTSKIRLSTGVLLAQFRPAVLLSKQISTLDHICRVRLDTGLGVGWMREEFDACGVTHGGRFGYMIDQIRTMRALWTERSVSIDNKAARFKEIDCLPHLFQPGGLPLSLGIAPNERNFSRIADVADGWDCSPIENDPVTLMTQIRELRNNFEQRGRNPENCLIRAYPPIVHDSSGHADIKATLAQAPAIEDAGVNVLRINAVSFVRDDNFDAFIDALTGALIRSPN